MIPGSVSVPSIVCDLPGGGRGGDRGGGIQVLFKKKKKSVWTATLGGEGGGEHMQVLVSAFAQLQRSPAPVWPYAKIVPL
jgi:hypothetical protein